jgi:hypothetical protein
MNLRCCVQRRNFFLYVSIQKVYFFRLRPPLPSTQSKLPPRPLPETSPVLRRHSRAESLNDFTRGTLEVALYISYFKSLGGTTVNSQTSVPWQAFNCARKIIYTTESLKCLLLLRLFLRQQMFCMLRFRQSCRGMKPTL